MNWIVANILVAVLTLGIFLSAPVSLNGQSVSNSAQPAVLPNVILWPAKWLWISCMDAGGPSSTAAARAHLAALRATGANYDWVPCLGLASGDQLTAGYLTWTSSQIRKAGLKVGLEVTVRRSAFSASPTDFLSGLTRAAALMRADAVYFDSEWTLFSTPSYAQLVSLADSLTAACQWQPGVATPTFFYGTGVYFPQAVGGGACPEDYELYEDFSGSYDLTDDQAYASFTDSPGSRFGYWANMTSSLSGHGFSFDPVLSHSGTHLGYFWFSTDSAQGTGDDLILTPYLLGKLCTFLKHEGWQGVALYPGPTGYSTSGLNYRQIVRFGHYVDQPPSDLLCHTFWEARSLSLVKTAVSAFAGQPYQVALQASGRARPEVTGSFAWAGTEPDPDNPSEWHPYYVNRHDFYLRHYNFPKGVSGWAITSNPPGLAFQANEAANWTMNSCGDDLTGMLGDYQSSQNHRETLHVASDPECTLTVAAKTPTWGSITVTPSLAFYAPLQPVQIVAQPRPGHQFEGWTVTGGRLLNPRSWATTLTLDGCSCSLTANFSP